jgi:hypothetical protein
VLVLIAMDNGGFRGTVAGAAALPIPQIPMPCSDAPHILHTNSDTNPVNLEEVLP